VGMPKEQCKGITVQGGRCAREARASGFCHRHDAELLETKRVAEEALKAKAKPLNEVLDSLTQTCQSKGWSWEIESIDEKEYRHASFIVTRSVRNGITNDQITGLCEVSVNDGAKVSLQKTSFYGYGITQLHDAMMADLGRLSWLIPPTKKSALVQNEPSASTLLVAILRRFHQIARQLRRRYDDRSTLIITDEYDVQDLLHAMLRGLFDDVRPEESTPSYAGGSARMDFLLKGEKTVIEAKMASARLRDKLIGEQLIIDIKRYQTHPDCKKLICFVYDPEGHVKNPEGLEKDLSGKHGELEVKAIIGPR
jgi:hypothetical protein